MLNSPVTGEFLAQRASLAENASTWWRQHAKIPFLNVNNIETNECLWVDMIYIIIAIAMISLHISLYAFISSTMTTLHKPHAVLGGIDSI